MSTAQLIGTGAEVPREAGEAPGERPRIALRLWVAMAAALLVVVLYAAFAHAAVALSVEARIQVVIGALAAIAAAGWLGSGSLRFTAPRLAIIGIALLTAFAIWSGITLFWSVAPDQTWLELNRALAYVLCLCVAIAIGATHARALELVARGFFAVAIAVTVYALGQKLVPGLHITGVFNLNQTGPLPRLQEPLGYWNALGLFVAMAVPIALAYAVDRDSSPRMRLSGIAAVELMLLVIAFTYSRGGLLALALALVAGIALSGARLRSMMWLALACLTTIPPLVLGLSNHALTTADVSLAHRESAGGLLAAVLIASLLCLYLGARTLLDLEQRVRLDAGGTRTVGRLLAGAAVALVLAGVVALSLSPRGLGGSVSHAWKTFTATRATSNYDPHRLLSADSENRWVWWKEAAGAFSDRPVAGWGAGSFGVVHLLYRRDTLTVQQPHSVPLQFLAETGLVGALLALGGGALLLAAATGTVRRRAPGPQRLLAAAVLAGAVAYGIHSLYDWDWDIPAVTFPALLLLGVLCGARRRSARIIADPVGAAPRRDGGAAGRDGDHARRDGARARRRGARGTNRVGRRDGSSTIPRLHQPALGVRLLALAAITLWLCAFALSADLPNLAAGKANSALVKAASSSQATLKRAHASAALASSLDPLSDAGLRAEATIALHQGHVAQARTYVLQALRRDPSDAQAWIQLEFVDFELRDTRGAVQAAARAIALDPRGPFASQRSQVSLLATPPQESATAVQTPLHSR
jgi:hypothetical protein